MRRRLDELPLVGLFLTLTALYAYFALNELWIEDFWIHAAIARELASSLFAPSHPLILEATADIPYWPYLAPVAIVARVTGLPTYSVLVGFGYLNLVLLLVSVRAFVHEISTRRTAAFFSIVAILLLWGPHAWRVSGFLHIDVFFYVLPYPSTFAVAASFFCLTLQARYLSHPSARTLVAVAALALLVVLVHSLTALFLFAGLAAGVFWKCGFAAPRRYVETAAIVLGTVGLASLWPFFPLVEAVTDSRYAADRDAQTLYLLVWERTWPALLALPFLAWRLTRNWRDPLVTAALAVGSVYAFGAVTQHWSYGRVLPYAVMLLQIGFGVGVAELIATIARASMTKRATAVVLVVLSFGSYWLLTSRFLDAYTARGPAADPFHPYHALQAGRTHPTEKFGELEPLLRSGTVTLADPQASVVLPAFGARVVALNRPSFFKRDYDERMHAVQSFFDRKTPPGARREILTRYAVNYVLLDKEGPARGVTRQAVEDLGGLVIVDSPALTLFEMPRRSATPR